MHLVIVDLVLQRANWNEICWNSCRK